MWDIRTPGFTRGYFHLLPNGRRDYLHLLPNGRRDYLHLLPNGRRDCGKTSFILSRVGLAGGRLI
jgi:hypothetical protein